MKAIPNKRTAAATKSGKCTHNGARRIVKPNPRDKSGTGGFALVHCAKCGVLLPDEC